MEGQVKALILGNVFVALYIFKLKLRTKFLYKLITWLFVQLL